MHRARGVEAGLTDVVARRWGRAAARCGSAWWRPHRREGRRHLWLAPRAAGEDERAEDGSKSENGSGWVGLTMGGDGDGGGWICIRDCHGGSVAGVDERRLAWPCAEESEGEKRRGECDGVGQLFKVEAVRQGGTARCCMEGGNGKGRGCPRRGAGQRGNGQQRPSPGLIA
jgi:hypothetical protein